MSYGITGRPFGRIVQTRRLVVDARLAAWQNGGIVVLPGEALWVQAEGPYKSDLHEGATGGGIGTGWAYPEGYYSGFVKIPPSDYNPANCVPGYTPGTESQFPGYPGSNYGLSLCALFVPASGGTPALLGNTGQKRCTRDIVFTAAEIEAAGGVSPTGWRVWLICNAGHFPDNDGGLEVALHRLRPEGSMPTDAMVALQGNFLGFQAVEDTPVAALKKLAVLKFGRPGANPQTGRADSEGSASEGIVLCEKDYSTVAGGGKADYNELGWALCMAYGLPTTVDETGGVYEHIWERDHFNPVAFQRYTYKEGSSLRCSRVKNLIAEAIGINWTGETCDFEGRFWGAAYETSQNDGITLDTAPNEVQTLQVNGSPTGGTYKLRFKGRDTAALAHNANAAAIQAALEALPTIGSGNVTVTGAGPFTVTFVSALGQKNQPLLEVGANNLSGGTVTGTNADFTITETTRGGYTVLKQVPMVRGELDVYMAAAVADLGLSANLLERVQSCRWSNSGLSEPHWSERSDKGVNPSLAAQGKVQHTIELLLGADAQGDARRTEYNSMLRRFLRIQSTSKTNIPGGSTKYRFLADFAVMVAEKPIFDAAGKLLCVRTTLTVEPDPDWGGRGFQIRLRNGVSSYAS